MAFFAARRTPKYSSNYEKIVRNPIRLIATIFNGTALASEIKQKVWTEVLSIKNRVPFFQPKLVAIAVGEQPASKIYLKRKVEAAAVSGLKCDILSLPSQTSENQLIAIIEEINNDATVNGLIVQLPLPSHMSETRICNSVNPSKDVDGFTQTNLGRTMQEFGDTAMVPCTVLAVKKITESIGMRTHGGNCVVIGRSHNVGLPIAIMLGADKLNGGFDMTTTLCHRWTPPDRLRAACLAADLVVSAAGVPGLVDARMVKEGAVVVDVGLTRVGDKVVGDVDRGVRQVAGLVTPVPGGVGPCTVACLMHNTLLAAKTQAGLFEN